ncbi:TIGR03943 family putative permease subunit [Amycolatopsis nigrescens]|uniref:TIGR03943 family putative permease subunit n=1 Tax=Amycolatopsis nigrescens TaxID=381445 RepID=UPI0003735DEA|nr:TIGR03943 family protein [Amycolatopsis nigrescens]
MRRETQNILLILLGGALLKIAVNGDYLRYVKPSQQPWVIAGGAVMLVLGVLAVLRDLLAARRTATAPATEGHEHHHPARSAWLLLVPVLAVFLVAPPALGSDSVTRTQGRAPDNAAAQASAHFPPLPAEPVVPMSLTDFVTRAGWDANGTLNGRTVSLSGFVVHDAGSTMLARMVISCCAADARPLTVRLTGLPQVSGYASDAWLEVTGQIVPGTATKANGYTADLVVATARPVSAPDDPYEY